MEQVRIRKSISVEALFAGLRPNEAVDASEIARRLFRDHTGYAGAEAASVKLVDTGSKRQPEQWLVEIETLYDDVRMGELLDNQQSSNRSKQSDRGRSEPPWL